jgi:imidazolonepropionase
MSGLAIWRNATVSLCDAAHRTLERGAIVTRGEHIEWVGEESQLPKAWPGVHPDDRDLAGAWVTPGLIDCHTHLVYAGDRATENAQLLAGASYEEIARRGGGIVATMRATRAASEDQLVAESRPRLAALLNEGVTTVEIKSGYGLTLAGEAKMLRVARRLGRECGVAVRTTLLAAHAVPPEFAGDADRYLDTVAAEWLPALHAERLVDAVDVFCDRIAFSAAQADRLLQAAVALGLPVKMHLDQIANLGGAAVAARLRALSCDHLEQTTDAQVAALAGAGVVAVLLPVPFYFLRDTQRPPIAAMRRHGMAMAVATDCNPGSAPGASLLLALHMASRVFGLTAEEALRGVTSAAARALGMAELAGSLEAGRRADFVIWHARSAADLVYWLGGPAIRGVVRGGTIQASSP